MGLDLDKLRAWFNSEEGKSSIEEYANKLAFQDVLKQKQKESEIIKLIK